MGRTQAVHVVDFAGRRRAAVEGVVRVENRLGYDVDDLSSVRTDAFARLQP